MKKLILIFIVLFVSHLNISAQFLNTELKQYDFWGNTHLHCLDHASKLLFRDLGYNYLEILNNFEYIRIGDLDEDETDLVYQYEGIHP